jgi:hypothetical protein
MNKINKLDEIFNTCLEEVLRGQSTVDDCPKRYPEYAAELEGLLLTSIGVSEAAHVVPPAGAKMRIRVALNERMAELSRNSSVSKRSWHFGWANAVVTLVLGLSVAGGSVAYAASGAMPGQALYPLKLDLEQALVSLTFSSDAKVELYTALNDRRVSEIVYLAQKGDSQGIAGVTSRIESNLTAAAAAKGLSANDYAAAKAAGPANSQNTPGITITDTSPGTKPPTETSPVSGGTVPPDGTALSPTTTTKSPGNLPEASVPNYRTGTVTLPEGGSALDGNILVHANSQINSLASIAGANNSPAVQAAIERALAAIANGYQALISQP